MQVFIPMNLGSDHWIVARMDLRKKNVWIYDLLVAIRDDKMYKDKFKTLQASSLDDQNMLDSTRSDMTCGVPTFEMSKYVRCATKRA